MKVFLVLLRDIIRFWEKEFVWNNTLADPYRCLIDKKQNIDNEKGYQGGPRDIVRDTNRTGHK